MPRLVTLGGALMGLALILPTAAPAQEPDASHGHVRRLCPKCLAKMQARGEFTGDVVPLVPPAPPVASAPGGCVTCQMAGGEAPGYASTAVSAPGYASVGGGTVISSEPAPIGVVRAGYQPGAAMPPASSLAPGHGAPNVGPVAPTVGAAGLGPHRRTSVLSHLFFGGSPRMGYARRQKMKERHAMEAYDAPGTVTTELPASMVYGRGQR